MNDTSGTHWSLVLQVGHGTSETAGRALEQLCQTYWYPVYAMARALGESPEDAADLTQEFFGFVFCDVAASADPQRGRFRAWIKGAFRRFRAQRWRHAQASKRGGRAWTVSFDAMAAEERYATEPRTDVGPDVLFDRHWFVAVMDAALERLRADYAGRRRAGEFDLLKDHLPRRDGETPYRVLAEAQGTSEAAVKMQVLRLRRRFAQLLLQLVADTMADPSRAREELRELQQVLQTT